LSEIEAASKLGITPELLFAYTRYAPKRQIDHRHKLPYKEGFLYTDLEEWDEFLWEPWATKEDKRPSVPSYVEDYLKVECRGKCALCGKGHKLETAHIIPYEESLSHHHHNLIRLCTDCHSKYDDDIISQDELQACKDRFIERVRRDLLQSAGLFSRSACYHVPQPSPLFVGREAELGNLRSQLTRRKLIIVEGIGGIGKTQLVLHALRDVHDVPTIWLDVESYETLPDLEIALSQALSQYSLAYGDGQHSLAALSQQSLLVVFDGLDRLAIPFWDEVLDFLTKLVKLTDKPRFVITTKIELTNLDIEAYRLALEPLSFRESEQLLQFAWKQALGEISSDNLQLAWLISFCAGHPLSLKLVVGLIYYYKNLDAIVNRLREVGAGELKDPRRRKQKQHTSLEVCIRAAYSCLNHSQKRLLRYISSFPAGCLTAYAEKWQESNDYHGNLAEIRRFFLTDVRRDPLGTERLHLLNPVREFVMQDWSDHRYDEATDIELEAINLLVVHIAVVDYMYVEYPHSEPLDSLEYGLMRMDMDLPNYMHALRYLESRVEQYRSKSEDTGPCLGLVGGLAASLAKYFFLRGLLDLGIFFSIAGIRANEELGQYGPAANQCMFLFSMQRRAVDLQGMEQTAKHLTDLAQRTSDAGIQALASMSLGGLAQMSRQPDQALRHYESAAEYFRNLVDRNAGGVDDDGHKEESTYNSGMLSLTLFELGRMHEHAKRHQKALDCYLEALRYQLQIEDFTNRGSVYHHLGNCYTYLGDTSTALGYYKRAIELFVKVGQPQFLSNSLAEIGDMITELEFSADLEDFLSEELVLMGLEDMGEEIQLLLARRCTDGAVNDQVPVLDWEWTLTRKTFCVIKLISFSPSAMVLHLWSVALAEDVLKPVFERFHERVPFLGMLNNILMIAFNIGQISSRDDHQQVAMEQIVELCRLCYSFDGLLVEPLSSFKWLAAWLQHSKLCPNVTGEQLFRTIEDFELRGTAFEISMNKTRPSI